jgi:TonB family protein
VKRSSKGSGTGNGIGYGSGSGSGSGSGGGYGNASVVSSRASVVNVTVADDSAVTDRSDTKINTTISRKAVEQLPKGTTFSGLLKIEPNVRPEALAAGFQLDGASGSENTFIIDGAEVTNLRTGAVGGRAISGQAVAVAEPVYPASAKTAKALGPVEVEIIIDREGLVANAKAVSGDETLRPAAEAAAMLSKFRPTVVNGIAVRVRGTIRYDFKSPDKVEVFLQKMKAEPLSDEDKRAIAVGEKLHSWLYETVMRLQKAGAPPTANESKFVREGRASVQLRLTAAGDIVLEKLRAAGLDISSKKDTNVSGRITVERLAALADVPEVKFILPKLE